MSEDVEFLKRQIAEIQLRHQQELEPYYDRLSAALLRLPPPPIVVDLATLYGDAP